MKKIKLFALAVMAMLSTNAFAGVGGTSSTSLFEFSYDDEEKATITRFVSDPKAAEVKDLVIPATVTNAATGAIYPVVAIAADAFNATVAGQAVCADIENVTFASSNLVTIGGTAFKACAKLKTANFAGATGLKEIAAGAFIGTALEELDLSKTRVGDVVPTAGNKILRLFTDGGDNKVNTALKTVKLSAYWKVIADNAFDGCKVLANFDFNTQNSEWLIAHVAPQTIGGGAFAGTAIQTLDLTTTTITALPALFGTSYDGVNSVNNNTLQTVKLPATCTEIANSAFENCTGLTSISMGAIATFGTKVFLGTALTELDLSGAAFASIPANTIVLADGAGGAPTTNATLQTVKLNATVTALNAAFANCTALSSINLNVTAMETLIEGEVANDAALTTITLTNKDNGAIALAPNAFESTGLTSIAIPGDIAIIPASAFENCADLEQVIFGHALAKRLTSIAANAFYNDKKLTAITLPKNTATNAECVAAEAFSGCTGLTTFTFTPDGAVSEAVVNPEAFKNCNSSKAITFKTSEAYATANAIPATVNTYKYDFVASTGESLGTMWKLTEYAKESGKYYVKLSIPKGNGIKIKAEDGTAVYDAYEDANKLYMCKFKTKGGYYSIGHGLGTAEDPKFWNCIVITTNKDLTYEDATAAASYSQNQIADADADWYNIVKYQAEKQRFSDVQAANPGKDIYGWVNSSTSGTGWTKLTSGDYFNVGAMYCPVTTPAAGRLEIVWLDEDGNVEKVEGELTAIQSIENEVEDGAAYNLAGQKVNAAYKGVVIKNGKKMIQK